MSDIIFNGVSAASKGIQIWSFVSDTTPEKSYTSVETLGRDGEIIVDYGRMKNRTRQYKISIYRLNSDQTWSYELGLKRLKEWLYPGTGYFKLQDTVDPSVYRMAYVKGSPNVDNILDAVGTTTIEFSCLPQVYYNEDNWTTIRLYSQSQNVYVGTYDNSAFKFMSRPLIWLEHAYDSEQEPEDYLYGDLKISMPNYSDQTLWLREDQDFISSETTPVGLILDSDKLMVRDLSGQLSTTLGRHLSVNSIYPVFYPNTQITFTWNQKVSTPMNPRCLLSLKIKPNHWRL